MNDRAPGQLKEDPRLGSIPARLLVTSRHPKNLRYREQLLRDGSDLITAKGFQGLRTELHVLGALLCRTFGRAPSRPERRVVSLWVYGSS